jgi:hypothetical protein
LSTIDVRAQLAAETTTFRGGEEIQKDSNKMKKILVFSNKHWHKDNRRENFNNNRECQQPFEPFESLGSPYNNNNNRFVSRPANSRRFS